jgi:hypothetical protein
VAPVEEIESQERPSSGGDAVVLLKGLPEISNMSYKAKPYIHAAIALQAMGQNRAVEELAVFAKDSNNDKKVIVLCRMLFAKKPKGEFRRAQIGGTEFVGDTDYSDWPLDPIELVDGVPFLMAIAWRGAPLAESSRGYLNYCSTRCEWSRSKFADNCRSAFRIDTEPNKRGTGIGFRICFFPD